jgi:hypothetical protein
MYVYQFRPFTKAGADDDEVVLLEDNEDEDLLTDHVSRGKAVAGEKKHKKKTVASSTADSAKEAATQGNAAVTHLTGRHPDPVVRHAP